MDKNLRIADPVHFDEFGPTNISPAERKLFLAVILRAVLDYTNASCSREHRRSAWVFLFEDDPELSPLRLYAELMWTDPDGFIERLRKGVRARTIRPKQVACLTSC